ncbi:MAG TPA: FlgD immunoglobulin-like domain containing protein [candidate division Zixibacteria bacterium]
MKTIRTIRLTLILVLVWFLTIILFCGGGDLWAKSQSTTFEMTSDAFCGTGGKAQSATFTLKASAGAQSSPVGSQVSTNFEGSGGWVYTLTPEFVRGDANGDNVLDVGDVVYLINFLFKYGSQPCPEVAGDENCDGNVDVGDVVFLINYLFKGGPHPCPGNGGGELKARFSKLIGNSGHARLSLLLRAEPTGERENGTFKVSPDDQTGICEIAVMGKLDREVAGVQLEIEFNTGEVHLLDPTLTTDTKNLQLFFGTVEGIQRIGILDLTGEVSLPAGEVAIVNIHARGRDLNSIKISKAVLADKDAQSLTLELSNELKREEVKNFSQPKDFSLSQNFPNPFNPQTSIRYALPQDANVKLVIYNVLGQRIKTLVDGHQTAGYNTIWWDGNDENGDQVASGIYFYRLEAGKFSEVKKMMLLK